MHKSETFKSLFDRFFGKKLSIHVQFFNMLTMLGIVSGIIISVIAVILWDSSHVHNIDISISAFLLILLIIAEKKKCYRICSWILIIAVFFIAFPLAFFFSGGHRGGMMCFFIVGITATAFVLRRRTDRAIALVALFLTYIGCFLLSFYRPELVVWTNTEEGYFIDAIISFCASGGLIITLALMRLRISRLRQNEIEELNTELEARNETLARYDRMKSDFFATVTHEINTPLAIISAASSDTLDLIDGKELDPEKVDEITENQELIVKKVNLIDNIILDLMDTVAIESGRLALSREPLRLTEYLQEICESHKNLLGNNRIAYSFPHRLPAIWADPRRIEQLMTNLLTNAAQHMVNGTVTISLSQGDGYQIVSVADDGEGMDSDFIKTAMRQYISSKADHWRHGIGLYVCRQIVVAHGGEINIESEKGRGTTVTFTLKEGK